jgi:hypothetical protein
LRKVTRDFFRFFSSYDGFMLDRMSLRAAREALMTRRPFMWTGHAAG